MPINLLDKSYQPTISELEQYIGGQLGKTFGEFTNFMEESYKARSQTDYSICAGKPGWNLKYKKSSKALCTIYPEKSYFIVLIVLGTKERELFDITREDYCNYITALYDNAKLFNGTKWLMINVKDKETIEEVKSLIKLKSNKLTIATKNKVG